MQLHSNKIFMRSILYLFFLSTLLHAQTPQISQIGDSPAGLVNSGAMDVDGDGDQDLISVNSRVAVYWSENLGDKRFALPRIAFYLHEGELILKFVDLLGDGALEMVTSKSEPGVVGNGVDGDLLALTLREIRMQSLIKNQQYVGFSVLATNSDSAWETLKTHSHQKSMLIEWRADGALCFYKVVEGGTLKVLKTEPEILPAYDDFDSWRVDDVDGDGQEELFVRTDGLYIFSLNTAGELIDMDADLPEWLNDYDLDVKGQNGSNSMYFHYNDNTLYQATSSLNEDGWRTWEEEEFDMPEILNRYDVRLLGVKGEGANRKAIFGTREFVNSAYVIQLHEVALEQSDSIVSVALGNFPNNRVPIPINWSVIGSGYDSWIMFRDLNGDQLDDVVIEGFPTVVFWGSAQGILDFPANRSSNTIGGDGDSSPWNSGNQIHSVVDFDNDGDLDFISGLNREQRLRLYLNDGKANFAPGKVMPSLIPPDLEKLGVNITSIKFADFNLDKRMDILLGVSHRRPGGQVFSTNLILKGLKKGAFDIPKVGASALGVHSVETPEQFVDWDGDGDLDAIYMNHWRRNHKGTLENHERIFLQPVQARDALGNPTTVFGGYSFGDVDRDGKLDCLAGISTLIPKANSFNGTSEMGVYYGNKKGWFSKSTSLPMSVLATDALGNPTTSRPPILFDINRDGYVDILAEVWDSSDPLGNPLKHMRILWNQGRKNQNISSWPMLRVESTDVMAGFRADYDGNGTIDLCGPHGYLSADKVGPILSVWHDFAGGIDIEHAQVIAMDDMDGDKDADILYFDSNTGIVYLVRNQLR